MDLTNVSFKRQFVSGSIMWCKIVVLIFLLLERTAVGESPPTNDIQIQLGESTNINQPNIFRQCPKACQCMGLHVDCSHRGLTQIPRNLPKEAEKM